jgi:hypothetical protein
VVAGAQRWSHLLRQLVVRVLAGKTGSHNGVPSSAGDWGVVWMNMVLALPIEDQRWVAALPAA